MVKKQEEWVSKSLSEILTVRHGKNQHNVSVEYGKFPILATGGQIGWAKEYLYDKPSVLIGRKGTINKPQFIDNPFWTIDTLFYTEISEEYNPKYIYYLFQTIDWLSLNEASGVPSLSSNNIEKVKVVIPNIETQNKIVEALSDMDDLIESLEKIIEKKKKIKQGTMQQLLTGEKRLPGFSKKWKEIQLSDVGKFMSGDGFPVKYQNNKEERYPFFKVSDMNNEGNNTYMVKANNYISEETLNRIGALKFNRETIVFAKIGAAIFLERKRILVEESCIDNNMMAFVPNQSLINSKYFYYLFVNTKLGSYANTTALPSLSSKELENIKYMIPVIDEQQAIAEILSDM